MEQWRGTALLGGGCVMLAAISIALSRIDDGMASLWLANAFAITLLAMRGRRPGLLETGAVLAGSLCANLLFATPWTVAVPLSVANAVEVGLSVFLIRLWLRGPARVSAEDMAVVFLAGAAGVPTLIGALVSAYMDWAAGWPVTATFVSWFGGSVLGAAMVMPVMLLVSRQELARYASARALAVFLALAMIAATVSTLSMTHVYYPLFVIGLMLLAVAVQRSAVETALLAFVSGATVIAEVALGLVPGLDDGAAAFAGRFQPTLAITVALPVYLSLLVQRSRADRRRVAESEQLFRRAMEDSAIGMAIVELDGRIRKANRALAEMLGYTPETLAGKAFFELSHPGDAEIGPSFMDEVLAGKRDTYRFEKRYLRRDGSAVWTQLAGSVIRDSDTGRPEYMIAQVENIDERKKASETVAEAESRWNFALSSARQGVWDLDLRKGRTYYSAMWKEMLGYRENELCEDDPDLWLSLIHPDDRQKALDLESDHIVGNSSYFEAEFRMRHKDGHWVWVLDRGKTIERDENGRTVRAIGTHTDITPQKEAQARIAATAAALESEKERLRVTLHSIGDAVICSDAEGRVTFMNPAAEMLTGHASVAAVGRPLRDIYQPRDEETGEAVMLSRNEEDGDAHGRIFIERADGARSSIRHVISPIVTGEGRRDGYVIVFQDFTDARTLQRQLVHAASHDSLTGLSNRAHFMATMRALLEETRQEPGTQHQLLFIDLDRFKEVNDTAGHMAGDALLKRIATTLRGCVRRNDFVARLGGDEFAIVLKYCGLEEAEREAEKVVRAIGGVPFEWEGQTHHVGASIGIASLASNVADVDDVIAFADRGCYASKAAGRGTVRVWRPEDGGEVEPLKVAGTR